MRIPDDREGLEQTFNALAYIARAEAWKVFQSAPPRSLFDFEDLEQEAEVALWEMLSRYRGRDNINAVVLGKAINSRVWRYVRNQESMSRAGGWYEAGEEPPDLNSLPLEEIEDCIGFPDSHNSLHAEEILRSARQVCNDMEYAALTGSCLHGLSYEAIGRSMGGKSKQWVEQCYQSAVRKVRAYHDQ